MDAAKSRITTRLDSIRRALAWAATAGILACHAAQAMITVGNPSDTDCNFHDIAAAVQAAGQSPGFDLIAVSGGPWTSQTTITDHDADGLTIEGGFANCSAGISTGRSTIDGSGAAPSGPLIVHSGNGSLTLLHLVLQNGKGGVQSVVAGPLTLSDVLVYSNHADYGGGLFVSGNDIFRMHLTLIGTSINSNSATANGGGLYLSNVDASISGGSNILANMAQGSSTSDGGGIYAIDSNITMRDHSVFPFPNIGSNYAQRNGGGVYYSTSHAGAYEMLLWNDRANAPIIVSENTAQSQGGGFYLSSIASGHQVYSFIGLENARIDNNNSYEGAAIYAFSSGSTFSVGTQIQMAQTVPGNSIPPCAAGVECNTINGNHAIGGSVVQLSGAGDSGSTSFAMYRGRMRDNRGGALVGGNAYINIESSLITGNEIDGGGDLMFDISNTLRIANSTIAYNTIAGSELFTVILPPASLEILHSLLVQSTAGATQGYLLGAGVPVTVRDIGALNVGISGTNVQFLTDPFVNSAGGNFHILGTSSAVDRWGDSGDPNDPPPTIDLDGALRPHLRNSPTTPYDFGAYEADAIIDPIFINGFDP